MKKLFLIVVILCSVGVLGAQETPAPSGPSAVIPGLETAAGFVIGGEISFAVGIAVAGLYFLHDEKFRPTISAGWFRVSAPYGLLSFTTLGVLVTTVAYSNLLENYNKAFPSDSQIMLPYLLLTYGGIAAMLGSVPLGVAYSPPSGPPTQEQVAAQNLRGGILYAGLVSFLTGMVVAVVHTQELLAKAKASGTAPAVSELSTHQDRITVMPDIGANYLGVAISMP